MGLWGIGYGALLMTKGGVNWLCQRDRKTAGDEEGRTAEKRAETSCG
jgi:hypothetical protein